MNNYYNNSVNYPYVQQPYGSNIFVPINADKENKIEWTTLLAIGIGIPCIVIIIWIIWAYTDFRYHKDRISGKLLKKYNLIHGKNIDNDKYYPSPSNIIVSSDKKNVISDMRILNKETNEMISTSKFSVAVTPDCSSLSPTCISL
jgi:hypothetical protein